MHEVKKIRGRLLQNERRVMMKGKLGVEIKGLVREMAILFMMNTAPCVFVQQMLQLISAITVRLQVILQFNDLMFSSMTVVTVKTGIVLYSL